MKQTIEIEQVNIAYQILAPEKIDADIPVIFLHDSLGSISVWKEFPKKVADRIHLKCIIYDRQGYGSSDPFLNVVRDNSYLETQANFLIKLLDALRISQCILFGHSDGGSIALIAAAKYPERIKGIITEGAHVFVEEITLEGIRTAVETYKHTDLKTRLEKHHGDKVENVFNAWTQTWLNPEFRKWNIEHFLEKIKCPVLVVQGEKDEYGSELQVNSICSKVQGHSEKLMIPSVGHSPHKEAPGETLHVTAHFIKSITGSCNQ